MFNAMWEHWGLLLAALVVVLVLGVVAVLLKYVRLMLNILRDTPPPLLMGPFDYPRVEGRVVHFRAFDGTSLRGMFLTPDCLPAELRRRPAPPAAAGQRGQLTSDLKGVIVFCHEYGSDMYSCVRYCRALLEAGFAVFTFDFRSQGASGDLPGYQPRLWCSDKEVSDCLGALALVRDELETAGLNLNIALFGISRGAGAAVLAAAQTHRILPIKALIADSAFSTDTTLEWSMKRWVHVFARVRFVYENHHPAFYKFLCWLLLLSARSRFNCRFPSVRKSLRRFREVPIFFIHGAADSYIQPAHTRALFAKARRPRYLWIVPDAKHNQSAVVAPELYAARTVAFCAKFLTQTPPADLMDLPETLRADVTAFFARDNKACRPRNLKPGRQHDRSSHRPGRRTQRRPQSEAIPPTPAKLPNGAGPPAEQHPEPTRPE